MAKPTLTAVPYTVTSKAYQINGSLYPRVTSVLNMAAIGKHVLKKWEEKVITKAFEKSKDIADAFQEPNRILKEAGVMGNFLHHSIEAWLKHEDPLVPPNDKAATSYKSFLKFAEEVNLRNIEPIGIEHLLFSQEWGYAGCTDFLGYHNAKDQVILFDWKSSNGFRIKYYLQLAAYWKALNEMYGLDIAAAHVITFSKTEPAYTVNSFGPEEYPYFLSLFKSCLDLYNFEQKYDTWGK